MENKKIKECSNCDEIINIDTDKFLKTRGCHLCKDCMKLLCYKCERIKHKCLKDKYNEELTIEQIRKIILE